jgi:hypothetical protein
LNQDPYADSVDRYNKVWKPRTFALRGVYDDYGRVRDLEAGPAQDLWLQAFQQDLVERGVGDNSCHDVAVSKSMTLEQILEAVSEARVLVRSQVGEHSLFKSRPHPGIPTPIRIRTALMRQGFTLAKPGDEDKHGFTVDLQRKGFVRVRRNLFGKEEESLRTLYEAAEALSEFYAVTITTGTGNYPHRDQIVVMPKPLPEGEYYGYTFGPKSHKGKLAVAHAMVREDVWQALLKLKPDIWNDDCPKSSEEFRKAIPKYWNRRQSTKNHKEPLDKRIRKIYPEESDIFSVNLDSNDSFTLAWSAHFELALDSKLQGVCLLNFLDTVADSIFIKICLYDLRIPWRPSTSYGPQFGEWGLHKQFGATLAKVSADIAAKKKHKFG